MTDLVFVSNDELEHYGIKGMKWGVRKRSDGVSRSTYRTAKKDAKESARAKMYYGEGAGTRRKLLNNTVKSRSKDSSYAKAFEDAYSKQDMAKRASEARSQRHRTDVVKGTAKTARGVKNTLYGNPQFASATAVALVAAYSAGKRTGINAKIAKAAKTAYNVAAREVKAQRIKRAFQAGGWL